MLVTCNEPECHARWTVSRHRKETRIPKTGELKTSTVTTSLHSAWETGGLFSLPCVSGRCTKTPCSVTANAKGHPAQAPGPDPWDPRGVWSPQPPCPEQEEEPLPAAISELFQQFRVVTAVRMKVKYFHPRTVYDQKQGETFTVTLQKL